MRYLILALVLLGLVGCANYSPNAKVLSMDVLIYADHNATIRGPVSQQKPITTTDSIKGGLAP